MKGKVLFRNLAILIIIFLLFSSAGGIKGLKQTTGIILTGLIEFL